jgi:hypothetical protein
MPKPKFGEAQVQLFQPDITYQLNFYVLVESRDEATRLAQALYGRYEVFIRLNEWDTTGSTWELIVTNRVVPDQHTIPRAQRTIQNAIQSTGARARTTGWDRQLVPPQPRYFKDRDDDDDDDDDDDEDDDGGFIGFRS